MMEIPMQKSQSFPAVPSSPPVFLPVFLLGLLALAWVAAVHAAANPLVLAVCLLIALVYLAGGLELRRYRRATASLAAAVEGLDAPPQVLEDWLRAIDPSLRAAVRLRVEGERTALPAPALAGYLSGVLVLLGMLGTLLGMMATLRGTGLALQSASDLQAVRDSLAAPVQGLGYAFGTSIAGIATSAALGVLAALCRRERLLALRALDAAVAGPLRAFTRQHRQEALWTWMQQQGAQFAPLAERLQALAEALDRRDQAAHAQLAARQEALLARIEGSHLQLAEAVRGTLQDSVAQAAGAAQQALQPVLQAAMEGIGEGARQLQAQLLDTSRAHLGESQAQLQAATAAQAQQWQQALDAQQHAQARAQAALLAELQAMAEAQAASAAQAWQSAFAHERQQQAEAEAARQHQWQSALDAQAQALHARWEQAGEAAAQRQQAILGALQETAQAIATQGRAQAEAMLAELGTLMQAAAEAPRAAAEVIGELRVALSDSLRRDTALQAERGQLLETVATQLEALNRAAGAQQEAIGALVAAASRLLEQAGARLEARIEADAGRLQQAASDAAAGALDIAGIGEAFAGAVDAFAATSARLAEGLARIEAALDKSLARSDEQLAYYVAQAREVVDLSLLAQRQIVDDLRRLELQREAAVDAA